MALLDSTFKLTHQIPSIFKAMNTITPRKIIISLEPIPQWNCRAIGDVHFNSLLFYEGI